MSDDAKPGLDADQMRQVLKALLEVQRSESGYGEVQIHIDKGRVMFITRCFSDRCLPRRLKHDDSE